MSFKVLAVGISLFLAGCSGEQLSDEEKQLIGQFRLSELQPLPADPTNKYADQSGPAAFGATLFFEQRLSRDGNVACSTCHISDRQFQDDRPFGKGVGETKRRTMPLAGVAYSPWFFWDGRRDSLWAQALGPLEDQNEHAGTRTAYAQLIAREFKDRYENIFGPLPDLSAVPASAGPFGAEAERAAWMAMSDDQRAAVDLVFANMGKAIAAFERTLVHKPTRFDRFADALAAGRQPEKDAALSEDEILGLRLFVGKARCSTCHTGPRFTDDHFHNTGVPQADGKPLDLGRETAVAQVLADPFNCAGRFRDGDESACGELRFMVKEGPELKRAFKTPSLRGAASRPPYMHAGQFKSLVEVVEHYAAAPQSPDGHSELVRLKLSEREKTALVAFLKTLAQ
ncbi:methylamine utilization protein [Pseudaminobacter sp. 19-2017]|uniref:Methylamine utilization protein n=1 Tax=Pseudaminobacter soli (ex Zhang et al. 2022) TaxID=2831468 RepID=A0A942DVD0_9HYPH|nr:cytochrome c peroxidase [Pseudaminobacter soli]MBS3647519.1 methylamine utilization protein [Pseudaminobacter soli]